MEPGGEDQPGFDRVEPLGQDSGVPQNRQGMGTPPPPPRERAGHRGKFGGLRTGVLGAPGKAPGQFKGRGSHGKRGGPLRLASPPAHRPPAQLKRRLPISAPPAPAPRLGPGAAVCTHRGGTRVPVASYESASLSMHVVDDTRFHVLQTHARPPCIESNWDQFFCNICFY